MIKQVKIPDDMQWANLVDEIESAVEDTSMIAWVGSEDGHYGMLWEDFKSVARDVEYRLKGGYCALAGDLVVKLTDGTWYEQGKIDGHFYHREVPTLKPDFKPFTVLVGQEYSTIAELNADDKADV
ncbi:hypothetical protein [Limosilactobacillus pontis]|uniref:DUF1642 domain-containing protein n=1 Tax=Limosilactobacillus pontis TaxID=35787 RepID=A0ABU7SUP8_9LACO